MCIRNDLLLSFEEALDKEVVMLGPRRTQINKSTSELH